MLITMTKKDALSQLHDDIIQESTSLYTRYVRLSKISSKIYKVHFPMGTLRKFPNMSIIGEFDRLTGLIQGCVSIEHSDEDGLTMDPSKQNLCNLYSISISLSESEVNDLRNAIGI